ELIDSSSEEFRKLKLGDRPEVWTSDIAYLYDTFGTPIDLAYVRLSERDAVLLDPRDPYTKSWAVRSMGEEEFRRQIEISLQERQQASSVGKTEQKTKTKPLYADVASRVQSLFCGYETTRVDGVKVLALIRGDDEVTE